jgi:HK97 family phage major capsid protein
MNKQEDIKRYNEAAQRVAETVEAIRTASDDADLDSLEKDFRAATAEAERCKSVLDRTDEIDQAEKRFAKRDLPSNPNLLGMDEKEVRAYSLVRAINAAATGDWRGAELEREASEAVARQLGRSPEGFFMPLDVQRQKRDLTAGTDSAGGYFVDTELRSQSFIEMLRNRMMVKQAGATILGGLVGDVAIPKQSGGATYYWVAESGAPTESAQTAAQVSLTPHTGGAYTDISRKLLKQSSIDVENFVRSDLATVCALGLDLAALHGTGADNQPTGIAATSGIGSVAGGDNGAAPDWDDIIDLETAVAVDNADLGSLGYMTNAKVRGVLKKTLVTATYGDRMVWDGGEYPLNGYKAHVSNQVSSTLTKGTSTSVCSAIFFGNWADLIIGQWGTTDILVDPYTGSTSGTVRVVALQDADIAVRHAESFAAMLDALTA